jgi:hypothetical protein
MSRHHDASTRFAITGNKRSTTSSRKRDLKAGRDVTSAVEDDIKLGLTQRERMRAHWARSVTASSAFPACEVLWQRHDIARTALQAQSFQQTT